LCIRESTDSHQVCLESKSELACARLIPTNGIHPGGLQKVGTSSSEAFTHCRDVIDYKVRLIEEAALAMRIALSFRLRERLPISAPAHMPPQQNSARIPDKGRILAVCALAAVGTTVAKGSAHARKALPALKKG
jgi:hypothetical protein